jgi:hypothetical protein
LDSGHTPDKKEHERKVKKELNTELSMETEENEEETSRLHVDSGFVWDRIAPKHQLVLRDSDDEEDEGDTIKEVCCFQLIQFVNVKVHVFCICVLVTVCIIML